MLGHATNYVNIYRHYVSVVQGLLNIFGTAALPLQSTFVIRFHHKQAIQSWFGAIESSTGWFYP